MWKIQILLVLSVLIISKTVFSGQHSTLSTEWDRRLPSLMLKDVQLSGSLSNTWSVFCNDYCIRSVFVLDAKAPRLEVQINEPSISVADLYNKLAEQCDYQWYQDDTYGVTWLFPRKVKYDELLDLSVAEKIVTSGLLFSDILEPLVESNTLAVGPLGLNYPSTFNKPVTFPNTPSTLKDLVNLLASSRVTNSFFVVVDDLNVPELTPINLSLSTEPALRPGQKMA